jgi:hypothetical protein
MPAAGPSGQPPLPQLTIYKQRFSADLVWSSGNVLRNEILLQQQILQPYEVLRETSSRVCRTLESNLQ